MKKKAVSKYRGLFKLRMKLLRIFPKTFVKSVRENMDVFIKDVSSTKNIHDYLYARHILSYFEDEEFTAKVLSLIAKWLINEKQDKLITTLTDIYTVDNYVLDKKYIFIRTMRPGLWIGKEGSIIKSLTDNLKMHLGSSVIDVILVEENGNFAKLLNYYTTYNKY